jgi:hypothetical protein
MVNRFSVGPSSYGDLRRVEQFVMSARIALQVLSVIVDFNAWQKVRGATGQLSVNEGMRSRARQTYLWVNRLILAVAVAMPFTSRHDEILRGNAVDFGITMPDGSNRALTAVEFAKLRTLVESRGGTWTGVNFGEPWHHEMATRAEVYPPYPNAAELAFAKPTTPTPAKPATPKPQEEDEDDMKIIRNGVKGSAAFGAYLAVSPGQCKYLDTTEIGRARQLVGLTEKQGQHFDPQDTNTLVKLLAGYGIPAEAANANWLLTNPTGDGPGLWTRSGANATRILTAITKAGA